VHAYTAPTLFKSHPAPRVSQQDAARSKTVTVPTSEDPFGQVPFQQAIKKGCLAALPPGPVTSTPLKAKHPAEKAQAEWATVRGGDLFGMDPSFSAKHAADPPEPLDMEDDRSDDQFLMAGDPDDTGQYQRLRASAPRKRATLGVSGGGGGGGGSSRDVSAAAFSNMSFNDEDELEGMAQRQHDFLSQSAHFASSQSAHNFGGFGDHGYNSKGTSSPTTVPPGQVAGKGAYDCGTWPRKHKRFTPSATAEPFSVRKK
jgi:hypothetical protein